MDKDKTNQITIISNLNNKYKILKFSVPITTFFFHMKATPKLTKEKPNSKKVFLWSLVIKKVVPLKWWYQIMNNNGVRIMHNYFKSMFDCREIFTCCTVFLNSFAILFILQNCEIQSNISSVIKIIINFERYNLISQVLNLFARGHQFKPHKPSRQIKTYLF